MPCLSRGNSYFPKAFSKMRQNTRSQRKYARDEGAKDRDRRQQAKRERVYKGLQWWPTARDSG
eukprot:1138712-Pelagomonas_calceolata.AAC.5